MENKLITIILPVYNAGSYLRQCLESILQQTFDNWELIIVNDGSTDNSSDIITFYKEKDLRINVFNLKNGGVSNARNVGLDNARGEFIMFVDADDWLHRDTLNFCIKHQAKSKADIVLFSFYRVAGDKIYKDKYIRENVAILIDGPNFKRRVVGFPDYKISEPTKTDAFNTPWAKLYRKSVIGDIRYIERSKVGMEDVLFNIEVINNADSFSFLDEYLYYYRLDNPNSLTKKDTDLLFHKFEKLFEHIESSEFFNESYIHNLNNRTACSIVNICLSLTHKNNRTGFVKEWNYLNSVLSSKRYVNAYKTFSLVGLPLHWKVFFFFAKYRLTTGLLIMSYIIRVVK